MNKVITNILWLGVERVSTVLGALIVTIYTAKHLGPEKMGAFYFALALVTIIVPISQLGSDILIFNRIVKKIISGLKLLINSIVESNTIYT